jgi:hypothetical protein
MRDDGASRDDRADLGRPYNEHTYRHLFAEICDLAIKGHGDVAPCPSLAFTNERTGAPDFKHDQDLRDTCVILLDRTGNDFLSICDVTGHSYQSAQTIMKHYRARNAAKAAGADTSGRRRARGSRATAWQAMLINGKDGRKGRRGSRFQLKYRKQPHAK